MSVASVSVLGELSALRSKRNRTHRETVHSITISRSLVFGLDYDTSTIHTMIDVTAWCRANLRSIWEWTRLPISRKGQSFDRLLVTTIIYFLVWASVSKATLILDSQRIPNSAHIEEVLFLDADFHHKPFFDIVAVTQTFHLRRNLFEIHS